ncbi:flagellar basal-body MS-ring/collar protein FliF [Anaerosalibacter bizertensis]|uniref:flagellar basal-body MS-ring/collar protein FliF n=1 Tax=Anaerosalibacter bizertensis TaxID=932217 RepID=UPI0035125EE9
MKTQLNDYWQKTDKNKKIKLGIISGLIIVGVFILIFFLTRPKYEVLYDNLSLKDMGQVTKKLDEMNIKWKTADDNENTILVPSEVKNKAKLELASEGLPKEGYGFIDAFDDSSWTMTDYEKKERMQYALQNELSSTISEIDGIESATVYIDEKDDSDFVLEDDKKETTASVFIKKSDNKPIPADKVTAIKNLVAGSINMDESQVSVIDDSGKLLTDNGDDSNYLMTDQYDIQQNIELKINESLRRFLENVFGYGNVDVRASAKINFDSEVTKIVEFSPPIEDSEEGLIRSMEEIEETMVGGEGNIPVGVDGNPPDYEMEDGGVSRYDKASRVINNELNEINREIKRAPGQVEGITVAVLINEAALIDGEMTEEKRQEISELVTAATGLDTREVRVSSQNFNMMKEPEEEEEESNLTKWILLGAGLVSAIIGFIIYRRKKRKDEEMELEDLERALEEEIEEETRVQELDFEREESEMKTQIEEFIEKKPEAVTQLLRSWLNE